MAASTDDPLVVQPQWDAAVKYTASVASDVVVNNVGDGPIYMSFRADDTPPATTIEGTLIRDNETVSLQVSANQRLFFRGRGSVEITEEPS